MSLDGLRAWIGEVERKLGARTRVFLVLTAIAIGGAAAGVYLGLEAQSNDVSERDVEAVETRLQEQIGGGPQLSELEAQVDALQAEVDALQEGDAGGAAPDEADQGTTGATGKSGGAAVPDAETGETPSPEEALRNLKERFTEPDKDAGAAPKEAKEKAK